jgi:phosphatidylglycerol lysyltransferase
MSLASARRLVLDHGHNATAYQILNPGLAHWFSPDGTGVVGYTRRGRVLLAAGEPVCGAAELGRVAGDFERFAQALGCRVCYVCAESRLRQHLALSNRHCAIALGAQPIWNPSAWSAQLARNAGLRAQLHRARNKGVSVELSVRCAASGELARVQSEWLRSRTLPPMEFLAAPSALAGILADRLLFVARRGCEVVAFLVASPVRARNGYLVELLARTSAAPNGTSELLIDRAMRHFAAAGAGFATLGLVALAARAKPALRANPPWLRLLMGLARAHANRFYNFRGLERFRAKLMPQAWEPVYAIANCPRFTPAMLYAAGQAFAGISPWRAIGLGMLKALGQELQGLRQLAQA